MPEMTTCHAIQPAKVVKFSGDLYWERSLPQGRHGKLWEFASYIIIIRPVNIMLSCNKVVVPDNIDTYNQYVYVYIYTYMYVYV